MLKALAHLIAPRTCAVCGDTLNDSEDTMCLHCLWDLPRTGIHTDPFNAIHRRLGHHVKVDRAAGWFWYTRGNPYTRLLLDAKYSGLPRQARRLGAICAAELARDGFFDGIDLLVPMPMYMLKRWRRGYNQAEEICRGVSAVTGLPTAKAVKAVKAHGIQARHGRISRYTNISGTMAADHAADIRGRHVLVVDDIITTGASITEAIRALEGSGPAAVSVLALGLTRNY